MTQERQVLIRCPVTGRLLPTGLRMSAPAFRADPLMGNVLRPCPACGGSHPWTRRDAFLSPDPGATPVPARAFTLEELLREVGRPEG